jgi:hypothetical protein
MFEKHTVGRIAGGSEARLDRQLAFEFDGVV